MAKNPNFAFFVAQIRVNSCFRDLRRRARPMLSRSQKIFSSRASMDACHHTCPQRREKSSAKTRNGILIPSWPLRNDVHHSHYIIENKHIDTTMHVHVHMNDDFDIPTYPPKRSKKINKVGTARIYCTINARSGIFSSAFFQPRDATSRSSGSQNLVAYGDLPKNIFPKI